jgi:hypothetical protein
MNILIISEVETRIPGLTACGSAKVNR